MAENSFDRVQSGGRTIIMEDYFGPTWCMEIRYRLHSAEGKPVEGTLHNTVHKLRGVRGSATD